MTQQYHLESKVTKLDRFIQSLWDKLLGKDRRNKIGVVDVIWSNEKYNEQSE